MSGTTSGRTHLEHDKRGWRGDTSTWDLPMKVCSVLWHKPQHLVLPTTIYVVFRAGIRGSECQISARRDPLCATPCATATTHSHVAALAVPCYRTMKRGDSTEVPSAQSTGSASLLNEVSLLLLDDNCVSTPTYVPARPNYGRGQTATGLTASSGLCACVFPPKFRSWTPRRGLREPARDRMFDRFELPFETCSSGA